MRIYLAVPYGEKDEAKKFGALFDGERKEWYAPNGESVLVSRWSVNTGVVDLVGEDRNFGGNDLFVDLIPRTCWFTNARYCVDPSDWKRLSDHVSGRVGNVCECCGADGDFNLDAHERWDYNESTLVQKLVRLVGLCVACHESTHMGYANVRGRGDIARKHLREVRGFSDEECTSHVDDAFSLWRSRNEYEWELDLSLLTSNGIKLVNPVSRGDRVGIMKSKLDKAKNF
jgi:Holliday junction resolvase-like predicted endonuclease